MRAKLFVPSGYLQVRDGLRKQVAVLHAHDDVASGQVENLHVTVFCRRRIDHRFLREAKQRIEFCYQLIELGHQLSELINT